MVVLRINVDLAIFQPYLDLEAGDNQSLKIQVARPGIEPPGPLAPQAKSLTTRPPLLPGGYVIREFPLIYGWSFIRCVGGVHGSQRPPPSPNILTIDAILTLRRFKPINERWNYI